MEDQADVQPDLVIDQTASIVAAYVSNNHVQVGELPALIAATHAALQRLTGAGAPAPAAEEPVEKPSPAQIRKSVTDEGLISFIDGKTYKTLKRHLTKHGLDPRAYRERYGLPAEYRMVAPAYAARRSALARSIGLGRKATIDAEPETAPPPAQPPKPRGRPKKCMTA